MTKLPEYTDQTDKDSQYLHSQYIDTESELVKELSKYESIESAYLYRGVNEARFKMFSSSQRNWIQQSAIVQKMGKSSYYDFIEELIRRTSCLAEVQAYMKKQNVSYNEMFILALMQHFCLPSPMLDFSHSLEIGLFFATDNLNPWVDKGTNNLDDYVSLYLIPNSIDWVQATIQNVMLNAAYNIENYVEDLKKNHPNIRIDTSTEEDNIREAKFRQFRLSSTSSIQFLPIEGPAGGRVNISIPILNLHCDYYIINDRIIKQQGMFIANFTEDRPLAEVMNSVCQRPLFICLNIRKNLIPFIRTKFLLPQRLTHNSIYCVGDSEVEALQNSINTLW